MRIMVISYRWSSYMRNTRDDLASCYLLSNSNTVFTIEIAPPTTATAVAKTKTGTDHHLLRNQVTVLFQ